MAASLYALDSRARETFLAFGAFFTASITPGLLALYLKREPNMVEDTLNRLQRRGLAERSAETAERAAEYRIHDLAYSYAKAQASDEQRRRALDACFVYLERHPKPTTAHFAALRSELDNFFGAASWAMSAGRYNDVMSLADWLYRSPDGGEGFLHLQGYAGLAITLLAQAAAAAQADNDRRCQAAYLSSLGSAYRDVGQVKTGMKYYRQALKLYRDLGDAAGEGLTLGRLGITYRLLGQTESAIEHLRQGLTLAQQADNPHAREMHLSNLGIVYRQLGQLETAVDYLRQALDIARARQDKRGEAINLGNLGDAYRDSRQSEAAVQHYRQALALARETGDRRGEAINLGRLGDTLRDQGQLEAALEQHREALTIARQMDDKRGEGYGLVDVAMDYQAMGQSDQALEHFRGGRAIFESLKATNQVARIDKWMADATQTEKS
jgi:tetratricopeptide (TPR) repeat protein